MELNQVSPAKITIKVETEGQEIYYEMDSEIWGLEIKESYPVENDIHFFSDMSRIISIQDYTVTLSAKHLRPIDGEGTRLRAWHKLVDTEEKNQ